MNFFAISSAIVFLSSIALFLLIISYRKIPLHLIWALFNLVAAVWGLGSFIIATSHSSESANLGWKIAMIGIYFLPVSFYHTVYEISKLKRKAFLAVAYLQSAVLVLLFLSGGIMVDEWKMYFGFYYIQTNIVFTMGFMLWFIISILGFYELYDTYDSLNGYEKIQAKYLFLGTLIGFIGGISVMLPVFGFKIYPFGNILIPVYTVIVTYAILKYQLLDIKVVLKKALFYSMGIALFSGAVIGMSLLSSWFVANIPGFQFWLVPTVTGIAAFIVGNIFWEKSKQIENALEIEKKSHQELRRINEVREEFVLATQHNLRTPISIIKGYLAAMQDMLKGKDFKKEEMGDYLEKSIVSANRLSHLANELLGITQMEIEKDSLKLNPIDVKGIIMEIIEELESEISEKNFIVAILPAGKWETLEVDAGKIRTAFFNLIDNAFKYTKEGGKISISGTKVKNFFQISIKDTGIGIDSSAVNNIFDEYFAKGKKGPGLDAVGRGVGLHMVASIIKEHRGRVYAKSEGRNKGSEFIVELPME